MLCVNDKNAIVGRLMEIHRGTSDGATPKMGS